MHENPRSASSIISLMSQIGANVNRVGMTEWNNLSKAQESAALAETGLRELLAMAKTGKAQSVK